MIGIDDLAVAGILGVAKRNWKPLLLGGVGLAAAVYIWILRGDVADLERDVVAAQKGEQAAQTERDIWQASAEAQAAGARDAYRVVEGQKRQIDLLTTAWRDTRADAEKAAARAKARAAAYAEAERNTTERSHDPKADPADIALRNFECLRRLREAGASATAATCRD
ncbi:hypothetical protein [Dongia sp.]|uniref:hypothetical protein n=1 Tax=Dongia sp. TaxID=1977262 RepID=UPI0035B27BB9